jgi:integrase
VWVFQYKKDVEAKGAKASWYVGWYDLDGKRHAESCGPGARGENEADKRKRRLEAELLTGTHEPNGKVKWERFKQEYETKIVPNLAVRSQSEVKTSLEHFQRIVKPGRMDQIRTQSIDTFVAARRMERGKNPESTISPATVNKDLRHIKAAMRAAHEWGYLPKLPRVKMLREPEKLPQYVTPEHFATIYQQGCPLAVMPRNPGQHYTAENWWRALLVTAYMTGWRISELLALEKIDLDLEAGTAITRHSDNKGKRDERVPLHAVVVEHLRVLVTPPPMLAGERQPMAPHPLVFRWCHDRKTLDEEFHRIQEAVGIKLDCHEKHKHTPACHVYGFHDLRRAFATVNAPRMKPEALQKLMRHKSYQTTLRYVGLVDQVREAVDAMPVPEVLQTNTIG